MEVGEVCVALTDLVLSEWQLEDDVIDGVGFAVCGRGRGGVWDGDVESGRHGDGIESSTENSLKGRIYCVAYLIAESK